MSVAINMLIIPACGDTISPAFLTTMQRPDAAAQSRLFSDADRAAESFSRWPPTSGRTHGIVKIPPSFRPTVRPCEGVEEGLGAGEVGGGGVVVQPKEVGDAKC